MYFKSMKTYTYPRSEKLKHKIAIGNLFENGKWKMANQLRVIFLRLDNKQVIEGKFGVSVSKRFFKRAVDRNRIKRLMRECYRLNKDLYHQSFGENTDVMLFWASKDRPKNYQEVLDNFLKLCEKVKKHQTSVD